ncbi:MAG: TRAP transporter substrate-binding protein DctP [Parasporobacterium sp.]|nr:TRAP transporter substrate-binding protein DctP [Parasporobacterium sp.]
MKKVVAVMIAAVMILSLCTMIRTTAKADEDITLSFATFWMENETDSEIFAKPWMDMISQACAEKGYNVEFECYWGGSLCSVVEAFKAAQDGTADITLFLTGMPGNFVTELGLQYPWNGVNIKNPSLIYETLYQEFPEIQEEYKGTHVLATLVEGGQQYNSNKQFATFEEAQNMGMLVSGLGEISATIFAKFNWSPVSTLPDEVYSALERGLIDGTGGTSKSIISNHWNEVTKYRYTNLDVVNQMVSIVMNEDVWNDLPEEVQEVFTYYGSGGEFNIGQWYDEQIAKCEEEIEPQLGMEIVNLDQAEIEKFQAAVDEAADEWAAASDANGLPGSKLIERMRELVAEQAD